MGGAELSREDAMIDAPAILLVDDNHTFVELVAEIIVGIHPNARIGKAASGEEALAQLSDQPWDIVLLDYRLPDFDGLEVLAEIRNRLIDVAVVMVTGEGDESLAVDLFRMGAYDYLVKGSISAQSLERSIGQALIRRMLARQGALGDLSATSRAVEERSRALDTAYDKLRDKKEELRLLSDTLETTVQERTTELNATSALLNEVLDSTSDHFIIACGPNGVIVSFNRGAEALFSMPASQVVGRKKFSALFEEFSHADGEAERLIEQCAEGLSPQLELCGIAGDGVEFVAKVSFSRLEFAGAGAVRPGSYGIVIIGSDVTHERELEAENQEYIRQIEEANQHLRISNEQIREATRLKNQFLANVSHELRTPLNAIIGYADLLHGGIYGDLSDKQQRAAGGISTRAGDLLALINDILDLARIEAGGSELRAGPFHVGDLLTEVVETGRVLGLEKQLAVSWTDTGACDFEVHTDRQKLKQVLLNLINNAIKFTSEGAVVVESRPTLEECVEVTVTDSGIGIPAEELEKIFDEFRQVDGSSTRKYGGTGLGLTISRKFARLLGGDLFVESEVGKGSTFRLVFSKRIAGTEPGGIAREIQAGGSGW
jgi:signal transduction histidine kinase/DNA-binding response OmpR family regulator